MSPRTSALAAVAPWLFVLLWSTGFIGARFGLPYIEPFTFLGLRFVIAASLLAGLALALRAPWPRGATALRHVAVAGLLLHAGYLGGVFFAIDRGMPAGLSALVVSLQPVLTAVIARRALGEQVSGRQWVGLALGLVGVAMVLGEKLLAPGAGPPPVTVASMTAVVVALFSTTLGTIYQKRHGARMPLLSGTALQYVAAGLAMAPLALLFETREIIWAPQLIFAMLWLVFGLSLGAILLLMLLLRLNSTARVASLFYLVPPATAVEAYLIFGERLGALAMLGLVVATVGVALVVIQPEAGPRAARAPARRG
ncbi:MAG TPA: DMT family transporter [Chloroflexaceae bacterium]|nr:DMT family transporter [Chloroflexaceae bacterium]